MAKADNHQATAPATAPAATPAAPNTTPDEHHGKGGMFSIVNGQRVMQSRSLTAEEAEAKAEAERRKA